VTFVSEKLIKQTKGYGMSILRAAFGGVFSASIACAAYADVPAGIAALEAGNVSGAVEEFQAGFDDGDADGAFFIGRLFEMGLGTERDMRRAVELYSVAADQGSALAQNRLGLMYLNGELVLQDYQRAGELICAAAETGDANSAFNCGLLFADGQGVDQDAAKAVSYWQQAAEQNHVAAINYLGQAYRDGAGVTQSYETAFDNFSRTGGAGNPLGLFELAKAYQSGNGVERNLIKAHGYANLASARGMEEARVLRDTLNTQLNRDDLEAAQSFARDWEATPLDQATQ
jgi:TPR repeat protein